MEKTLEQAKDEVAKEEGRANFNDILDDYYFADVSGEEMNNIINRAAELHANSKAAKAWEEGQLEIKKTVISFCEWRDTNYGNDTLSHPPALTDRWNRFVNSKEFIKPTNPYK